MTESFLHNLPYYKAICEQSLREDTNVVNNDIIKCINNIVLKINAEHLLKKMKYVQIALDKLQSETCKLSDATHNWLMLLQEDDLQDHRDAIARRLEKVITLFHIKAGRWLSVRDVGFLPSFIKYKLNDPILCPEHLMVSANLLN